MRLLLPLLFLFVPVLANAQQTMDEAYGEKIAEFTTDERFLNDLIDHLPASDTVPSPLDYFGTIIGAEGILHYTEDIYGYLRALADASPRVMVRNIGYSEEDREMIEVIIADEATIADLEPYRVALNRLADPRSLSEDEASDIIASAKPIYYLTAGLHSSETGSPEMVMELAYRLAVEESDYIRSIRDNVITMFTPAAEPDGRDRMVDVHRYSDDHNGQAPNLTYWGKYVAHDNNRDGYGMALNLTRNLLDSFHHWKPQVMHDLHESVPYLYVSTGLGPYNEWIDPITVDEWHNLAYEDVSELTRVGMPGVWTHAFYNGWAANYLIWMANLRNSNGRFYETFGNSHPGTFERKLGKRSTATQWYRPNPPLETVMWSLRNNTNYMQSGVLASLKYTADNAHQFVENFWLKSSRAVEKGRTEAPYAWVIPHESQQDRPVGTTFMVNLLMDMGLEVHQSESALSEGDLEAVAGSYIVRLDQPYRTLAQVMMDRQNFPEGANAPYDDTGWTLPLSHRVDAVRVDSSWILDADMTLLEAHVAPATSGAGRGKWLVLNNTTDDNFALFRYRLSGTQMEAAESEFEAGEDTFHAGSLIFERSDSALETASELGLQVQAFRSKPDVAMHNADPARVGLIHTWTSRPQDAGWWRFAFDEVGIPYTYLSEQDLATTDLSQFDVLILPRTRSDFKTLVHGNSMVGEPTPWEPSEEYPHIGHIDQTDDTRRGMGYAGVTRLQAFVEGGGVFLTSGPSSAIPIDAGLTRRVSIRQTRSLQARGSLVRTQVADSLSPIAYGYPHDGDIPAYFSQSPVFSVNSNVGGYRTPDWQKDLAWETEVPRTVLSFAKSNLNMSGMLQNPGELQGAPAVLDVPVGDGHVILFATRPVRRWNTHGNHALVWNVLLNWNDLRVGWPERKKED